MDLCAIWDHSDHLADLATVVATGIAAIALPIGFWQFLEGKRLQRESVAHQKLSQIYEIAIDHPHAASGDIDLAKLPPVGQLADKETDQSLWVHSAILASLEFLYLNFGQIEH
jgi:hypothetical protein